MRSINRIHLFMPVVVVTLLLLAQVANAAGGGQRLAAQATGAATAPATETVNARFATRTPSPTPNEPIYAQFGADNMFPMLIRIWTAVRLPAASIRSIKVRVFQEGIIDQEIDVPTKGNIVILGDNASLVFFAWPLTTANAPQPFKEISFTWVIESPQGSFLKSDPYFLPYEDARRTWGRQPDTPIALYWHNLSLNIKFLSDNLKRAYSLLQQNAAMNQQYQFVIYEAGAPLCDKDPKRPADNVVIARKDLTVYPCDPQNAARLYAARGMRLIQRTSPLLEQLQDDLIMLMADDAYRVYFKAAPSAPPAWVKGGLVQLYGLVGRANALLLVREQARQDRLLTLDELAVDPVPRANDYGATVRNWNSQAYMLMLYLAARFGVAAPIDLSKQILAGPTFDDAIRTVTKGMTPAQLYNDWKTWLLTADADNAIRWNIYATQPTPTVTLAPTDYPTYTPVPIVPSLTPTLFPSKTPTPSLTPTPILPSNTPRPPGSLATVTPAQAATP
jgi:hypothetical protein